MEQSTAAMTSGGINTATRSVSLVGVPRTCASADLADLDWKAVKKLPLDRRSDWLALDAVKRRLPKHELRQYLVQVRKLRLSVRRATCSSAVAEEIFRNGGDVPHARGCDCYDCRAIGRRWPGYYVEPKFGKYTNAAHQLSFECYLQSASRYSRSWPSSPGNIVRVGEILGEVKDKDIANMKRVGRSRKASYDPAAMPAEASATSEIDGIPPGLLEHEPHHSLSAARLASELTAAGFPVTRQRVGQWQQDGRWPFGDPPWRPDQLRAVRDWAHATFGRPTP